MQLTVRPTGAWQHTLDIQIPPDEVERGLDDVARKVQRRAALPGFRKDLTGRKAIFDPGP